jgi:hypothetical protein
MTSSDRWRLLPLLLAVAACGGGSGSGVPVVDPGLLLPNVLPVSVNGPGCSAGSYLNKPCVSVTVCVPGTATCQVINDLLLDTGSTGLRVFSQVMPTLALPQVVSRSGVPVAECIHYLDGSSQWGPVVQADVVLGGEPAVRVSMQRLDATFGVRPSACSAAQASPGTAGFNGILGLGNWMEDCGSACLASNNGLYFACASGGPCTPTGLDPSSQVQNPVSALPVDNNGMVVRLPAVPGAGGGAVAGHVILGIGTRSNNLPPSTVRAYPLDGLGEFKTTLGGVTVPAFVDTGSNGLFFAPPAGAGLITCPAPDGAWYCPAATVSLTATNAGAAGTPAAPVSIQISSIHSLSASVAVSAQVGGSQPAGSAFDWGLPFHLGRDVYLGLETRTSSLGTGPLVAY